MKDLERADQLSTRSPRELALLVVEAEKQRDEARGAAAKNFADLVNAMADMDKWKQEALRSISVARQNDDRAEAAEQQSAQLRSALAELVRQEDLITTVVADNRPITQCLEEQDAAWAAARKALEP